MVVISLSNKCFIGFTHLILVIGFLYRRRKWSTERVSDCPKPHGNYVTDPVFESKQSHLRAWGLNPLHYTVSEHESGLLLLLRVSISTLKAKSSVTVTPSRDTEAVQASCHIDQSIAVPNGHSCSCQLLLGDAVTGWCCRDFSEKYCWWFLSVIPKSKPNHKDPVLYTKKWLPTSPQ